MLRCSEFDKGEVIAVVGALGTLTGNATYVGLSVNRVEVFTGVVTISDVELKETASAYDGKKRPKNVALPIGRWSLA